MSFRSGFISIITIYVPPLWWRIKEIDEALDKSSGFDDSYASGGVYCTHYFGVFSGLCIHYIMKGVDKQRLHQIDFIYLY